jgi:hypothetical protein
MASDLSTGKKVAVGYIKKQMSGFNMYFFCPCVAER